MNKYSHLISPTQGTVSLGLLHLKNSSVVLDPTGLFKYDRKIAPWGLSVISPIGGETGHLTDEAESILFECPRFRDGILRSPVFNAVTEIAAVPPSKHASKVVSSFRELKFWGRM